MHRGAMNRVRSEEAALSRRSECRGKPGPWFFPPEKVDHSALAKAAARLRYGNSFTGRLAGWRRPKWDPAALRPGRRCHQGAVSGIEEGHTTDPMAQAHGLRSSSQEQA